jgi:hypothetical protein
MLAPLVAVGLTLWLLNHFEKSESSKPEDEEWLPPPGGVPTPKPGDSSDLPPQQWTEMAQWSGEYAKEGYDGTERVVWFLTQGIRYTDGSTEMSNSTYIVIGNKTHTAFRSQSTSNGAINIKWEYTGGTKDAKNVIVYSSLEAAIAEVDKLSKEPDYDPTDPVQPQPQPEDEEEDDGGFGGLPSSPGYQLGQGMGSFSM